MPEPPQPPLPPSQKHYRLGELDRRYPLLGLEQNYLYAYGVMPLDAELDGMRSFLSGDRPDGGRH